MRLFLLLLFFPFALHAQSNFVTETDASGETIVRGTCTLKELREAPSSGWLRSRSRYKPNREALNYLRAHLPEFKVVVLFGSWCGDTRQQLPHFYTILEKAKMPPEQVQLVGFDREKRGRDMEHKIFKMDRLPTFIVYKGRKEIGRIVETPQTTLEEDLVRLISPEALLGSYHNPMQAAIK